MRQSLSVRRTDEATVIEARGLVKRFGTVAALDGLDLEVRSGEVHGFLGPNGAGKTTALRALLGQLRLTAGQMSVFGLDPWRQAVAVHERLAYVPGDVSLWPSLTGGECIDTLLRFHGSFDPRRRDALVERFALDPTRRARTYSKGNRQKVALIAGLAADAELLLLDEPTSGLDPLMEAQFQEVVREATEAGRTVLLSSHILGEVEALCDRVTIIREGRTVLTGALEELRSRALTSVHAMVAATPPALGELAGVSDVHHHQVADGEVRLTARVAEDALAPALKVLLDGGAHGLQVHPPSLDELFLDQYREASSPAGALR